MIQLTHDTAPTLYIEAAGHPLRELPEQSAPTQTWPSAGGTVSSCHLQQGIPDAELLLFPDSGHGSHFQYPQRFLRRVRDFLDVQSHEKKDQS